MNKIKEKIPNYKIYLLSILVIIIDQISKLIVVKNMNIGEEIVIIKKFFSILYVTNTGAAFSMLENSTTLLIIISLFCLALIVSLLKKEKDITPIKIISFGILIGGMISNLIDRVFYKNVIDFLSFTIFNYKFPVFNIADIGITIGVALVLFLQYNNEKKEKKYEKQDR
ncbi:MAG: signal peptidase II [Bacilli bacterium]|nr:signal peptidase II [Bacilli bacterium]